MIGTWTRAVRETRVAGLAAAIVLVALATLARAAVDPVLPPGFPFLTYFPVVIVTTYFLGLVPGVAAALLSLLAAWWFFMPMAVTAPGAAVVALVFFASIAFIDIAIIHGMNRAFERLEQERARSQRLAAENETMLHEAQHRISNNLQMLASILTLQRNGLKDESAREALAEAANRLKLVGKIQRDLYGEGGTRTLDVFLRDLAHDAVEAAGSDGIAVTVTAPAETLAPEQLTPLGLVMLELVSNAIEHGRRADAPLAIEVRFERAADTCRLVVVDDGVGLPPDFDVETSRSLGLRIVRAMAAQLGGSFSFLKGASTVGVLAFPHRSDALPA